MSVLISIIAEGWQYIAGAIGVAVTYFAARRSGANKVRAEYAKDKDERESAGRTKVSEGRGSGLSPADRVRRNDGDWRGV